MGRFYVPISINPSFWIASFLIGWAASADVIGGFLWVFVVLISVLLHEFGHALSAIMFGQRASIELGMLGGMTYRQGPELSKPQEFIVVVMGPLCSIALALVSYGAFRYLQGVDALVTSFFQIFFLANAFWSVLNLVPVLPLDGGRLMQIVLSALFGKKGYKMAYFLSFLSSSLLMVLALYMGAVIIGCLFLLFAFDGYKAWKYTSSAVGDASGNEVQLEMMQAEKEWQMQHPESAIERLERICDTDTSGKGLIEPVIQLSNYLLATGKAKKAFYYLKDLENRLSCEGLKLLQLAAYETMEWKRALSAGEKTFLDEGGDVSCALINALSAARLTLAETAVNWLQSAQQSGSVDMQKVVASEDFDLIRNDPVFIRFLKTYGL